MDKFYMTGFAKFNHTHDAKGKFSTDAGTISTSDAAATMYGTNSPQHLKAMELEQHQYEHVKDGSAGKEASNYNINNPGPAGVRNTEVAGRISESVKSGKSLTATYTTPEGKEYKMTLDRKGKKGQPRESKVTVGNHDYKTDLPTVGAGDLPGVSQGVMQATDWGTGAKEIGWIEVAPSLRGQGIGTAMVEFARRESDIPIEHSTTLTDDGEKFVGTIKSFYQTGVAKDVGGDIHVDALLGSRTEKPKKKKPKHDGEMRVEPFYMTGPVRKYNQNHDAKGRFGTGAGGTIHDSYAGLHQAPTAAGENPPLTRVTDIYPSDVLSSNGVRYYGMGDKRYEPDEHKAVGIMREAKAAADAGKPIPKVKVYRAIPASVKSAKINRGDWVTPSKIYAQDHGAGNLGEGVKAKIISAEVPADHLYTDANSLLEWGYDPPVKKSIEPFYMVGFEKFNHNHDSNGRFSDNVGGGAHGIGVETPAMRTQNAERWATTVAARQRIKDLRVELNDVIRAETVVVKSFYQTGPVLTKNDDTAHVE